MTKLEYLISKTNRNIRAILAPYKDIGITVFIDTYVNHLDTTMRSIDHQEKYHPNTYAEPWASSLFIHPCRHCWEKTIENNIHGFVISSKPEILL